VTHRTSGSGLATLQRTHPSLCSAPSNTSVSAHAKTLAPLRADEAFWSNTHMHAVAAKSTCRTREGEVVLGAKPLAPEAPYGVGDSVHAPGRWTAVTGTPRAAGAGPCYAANIQSKRIP